MRKLTSVLILLSIPTSLLSDESEIRRADDQADAPSKRIPLFRDLEFRRGFNLNYPSATMGRKVAAVLRPEGETRKPLWRLAQWGTKHSLADAKVNQLQGGFSFENSAKRISVVNSHFERTDLVLDIRGSVEYGRHARKRGEAWPHLLIEQHALVAYRLTELADVALRADLRLLSFVDNMSDAFDPNLHSAQFQLFLIIKNVARGSPDYQDYFWFGVPFFDKRHDFPPPYRARDGGKKDATGKFIYTIAGKTILPRSMKEKRWVHVEENLLPHILDGLKEAVARGYLESDDAAQYAVVNMNMGWELPGNYDAAIQVRNFDVSVRRKAEDPSSGGAKISPESPWRSLQRVPRKNSDAGDHPGNVHVSGEDVRVRLSPNIAEGKQAKGWRLLNDVDREVAAAELEGDLPPSVSVGKPGIGWYRLELLDADRRVIGWTTAAVLAPLLAPVPQDSPICIDAAVSWFARDDPKKQKQFSRLAALAGVNWIRDRLKWADIQPGPGKLIESTTYDTAAREEAHKGLKILQVFHDTPAWAAEDGTSRGRLPPDLRTIFRFCGKLAKRFKGHVQAWEPWNEANIHDFGGHTSDAICSFQKAAYLGFKTTDPSVTVCWNAHAGIHTRLHARGVLENEAWPYFETYNIHSYDWPHSYVDLWKFAREAASGRPLWVTESDRGSKYSTGDPWFDLSRKDERLKAEFMAQSYALSFFAGSQRHFHFILGHYYETRNKIQFGLLRSDMTPRPAYVSLAALGRFLAGAKCLGRVKVDPQSPVSIIAFRAIPDGVKRDVLVAWAEKEVDWPERGKTLADWPLPKILRLEAVFDYLGRELGSSQPTKLRSAPTFVVLPEGECDKLSIEPPQTSAWRDGKPSPVVLQLHMPRALVKDIAQRKWAQEFHYLLEGGGSVEPSILVYNFGSTTIRGQIVVDHLPKDWTMEPMQWDVSLAPMERSQFEVRIDRPTASGDTKADTWIKLRGDFGPAGGPVLAFRLIASPEEGYER